MSAQKRRDACEVAGTPARKLADAITKQLFSTGRKPEKGQVQAIIKNIKDGAGGSPKFSSYAEATGGRRQEEPARSEIKTIPELNKAVKGLSGEVKVQEQVVEKVKVQEQMVGKEEFGVRLKEMEEIMLGAMSTHSLDLKGVERTWKRRKRRRRREREFWK